MTGNSVFLQTNDDIDSSASKGIQHKSSEFKSGLISASLNVVSIALSTRILRDFLPLFYGTVHWYTYITLNAQKYLLN